MSRIHAIVVGPFEVNCWVIEGDSRQVIIIDPGDEAARIAGQIRRNNWTVSAWIATHGHMDHLCALAELATTFPAPIAIHPADKVWAFSGSNAMPPHYPAPREPGSITRLVKDGDRFTDAGLEWQVIETPGHTPGGICIHFPSLNSLFTGDTLFAGSVGRTDFPGGNYRTLINSLRRLKALPGNPDIYAGHGPATTLDAEKRTNNYLHDAD
jgi:glyoxylase-like metal-dependent hydrolase (beta-lactamase superfamily II)